MIDPTKLLIKLKEREQDIAIGLLQQPPANYADFMSVVGQAKENKLVMDMIRDWYHIEDDKE